jgi:mRNA-degrading endonuclease RelE of RelBE toxin-antitoxin system
MAWKIQRTESFDKWWEKEDVEDSNYKFHEKALQEFRNIPLPHNVQTNIFKNGSFECWVTRLPDKARQQGKSGGFRVVLIIDLEEDTILLQGIFRRDHLGWQGNGGKYDYQYEQLIKDLAQQFVEAK